ncbi:permease [Lactonifactor sp. BIOML-A3]|uniref:permease n=1 Tax=Lactonifactor TaxID=420345 RepID=UPI0012B1200E|nr:MULTISPECIES: permease [Lactonifactor]MCB5713597.1 permease [Lactonifactor longoviformis]MCB5717696.1 permease [Lactonifactor longoviformis]MSA04150.1 permease [Lactonifactor sp. BIOML-A5]MSA09133.1 permease [Lactonifactor sp. BIOML-A4]MSA14329.1 permease [Lactonifactor sp. BIOML-A3]
MKILKKAKDNAFLIVVAVAYTLIFVIKPDMGVTSIKNSAYYIKEMFMIMPVIFVLTALLDTWVAKEKITKYLGKESKIKGIILSFVLGSISAGPIYAAFPMCVMLHKKGASVRNLVIILSSWAVIKVPMLLNEAKFLGMKFMAIRWVLTVIAIVVFSWIAAKIVKDEDIVQKEEKTSGLTLNRESCMGCTLCTKKYSEIFGMQGKKAYIKSFDAEIDKERLSQTILACPVRAIDYIE